MAAVARVQILTIEELLAQPEWALGAVVGLPLVAGAVAWLTNWLAEAVT